MDCEMDTKTEKVPEEKKRFNADNILTLCLIGCAVAGAAYLSMEALALGIGIIYFLVGGKV